jgi:anti-anti-sigma factor
MVRLENNQLMVTLPYEFNIYIVEELKLSIMELLDMAHVLRVSLENVQIFDSSAFSLLVALKKEVEQTDKTITFINISTEVMAYIETMRVSEFFEGGHKQ